MTSDTSQSEIGKHSPGRLLLQLTNDWVGQKVHSDFSIAVRKNPNEFFCQPNMMKHTAFQFLTKSFFPFHQAFDNKLDEEDSKKIKAVPSRRPPCCCLGTGCPHVSRMQME